MKDSRAAPWRHFDPARFAYFIPSGKAAPGHRYFLMHFRRDQNALEQ
jgi:hypothetical protein